MVVCRNSMQFFLVKIRNPGGRTAFIKFSLSRTLWLLSYLLRENQYENNTKKISWG